MIKLIISLFTKALLFLFFAWLFIPSYLPSYIDKLTKHLFLPKQQAVVLMYHHISNHPVGKIIITPELFGQHLNILQKEGYHVISLEQYASFLEGKSVIPVKSAVITFDDGNESFYTYAYPQLLKKHMPATDFVIVGLVGNCNLTIYLPS
jgi:biofilm PGA synthesis lipoprotein PgaB